MTASARDAVAGTADQPPVLHLRRGDPLPPLPQQASGLALAPGAWTLLVSLDAAQLADAHAAAAAAVGDRRGLEVAYLVRGAVAGLEPPDHADPASVAADRLGALADATGARAAVLVLVEPRQTVQASVVGCDAAAFSAVLAPLAG